MRGIAAVSAVSLGSLLAVGCAWANPDNRPVWNAFEEHLVPEDDAWFIASLPLTAPAGLLAVVADTLVVHPAQVVDDAGGDAGDLWTDPAPDWDDHYYTEMAGVPFRAAATPLWFVASFLGRSMFDIPPHDGKSSSIPVEPVEPEEAGADPTVVLRAWLDGIAAGADDTYRGPDVGAWTDELTAALKHALDTANANGRFRLYQFAMREPVPPEVLARTAGLRDRDPVVRYRVLLTLPRDVTVDPALIEALESDPVDSIQLLARRRFTPHEER